MEWIISANPGISGDHKQLQARAAFISDITSAKTTPWSAFAMGDCFFHRCNSFDGINATLITAHVNHVSQLCVSAASSGRKSLIANTCEWIPVAPFKLLKDMRTVNPDVELWFSEQEQIHDNSGIIRYTTRISIEGTFEFPTSYSERQLFRYRNCGFEEALRRSFTMITNLPIPYNI